MKHRHKIIILLGLLSFTSITAIMADMEGKLKYGGLFCLIMVCLALAKIFIRNKSGDA
ncbi:MAG: hypothetical protein LBD82_00810 [Deltaproteobacteria bacterium]|jgi:hypothetical protein|nr:hypothetical protein [Deltaproteobacteria bacterium]